MQENQELYDKMMQNESLAPIAELAGLVIIAKRAADKARELGNTLSQYAVRAETALENLPPVQGWMDLCDIYKNGAREFADKIDEAVEASRINELQANMEEYNKVVAEKMVWMLENDDEFASKMEEELNRRGKNRK